MNVPPQHIDGLGKWFLIPPHARPNASYQIFAPRGISPVQFGVQCHPSTGAVFTQADLAREVLARPQSISGVLDGLVERGVSRCEGAGPKDAAIPALTDPGHALTQEVWPAVQTENQPDQLGLLREETDTLNAVLPRLAPSRTNNPCA
ncbi:hypothetical protein Kisp01_41990 [Kineosporia sp. NBRC 101677]|uniref:MarR family winged helix-turn-helix transcriptional regulator n=1 Tax=Kineosporia sp. NBRC 101677 TaxID=3032197 RepID=UPI0024A076FE|nr:hypothetical protein [Kineosporia sp. NBRC 101677]GLY17184.1 hypothetical protein Kisp01_41990 [Kineosporia sp. NBRC 101677]